LLLSLHAHNSSLMIIVTLRFTGVPSNSVFDMLKRCNALGYVSVYERDGRTEGRKEGWKDAWTGRRSYRYVMLDTDKTPHRRRDYHHTESKSAAHSHCHSLGGLHRPAVMRMLYQWAFGCSSGVGKTFGVIWKTLSARREDSLRFHNLNISMTDEQRDQRVHWLLSNCILYDRAYTS